MNGPSRDQGKENSSRGTILVCATHHDFQRVLWQWPPQRLRFIPMSRHSSVVRITGMAFGWIGTTTGSERQVAWPRLVFQKSMRLFRIEGALRSSRYIVC
jgi:hypothetical protein